MTVAIYARVSTETQEQEKTIDSQIIELEELANAQGHTIINKYIDNGYSGTLLARPELDKLRDDAQKHLFEAVIIHSPDRLARRYAWQEIVIEELKSLNIQVIFKNRPIAETAEDQLLLGVQGIVAEYERAKFVERTRRGRLHRAKSGHILGNIPPYGYKCIKKADSPTGYAYYEINEDEAKIVKLMFSMLINEHKTTYGVITSLHDLGIKARNGRRWAKSSVAKILNNSTYTGTTFYNKHFGVPSSKPNGEIKYHRRKNNTFKLRPKEEWIPINVPSIISEDQYKQAQFRLRENARFADRNTKLQYLLKGLIKCAKDTRSFLGLPMHGRPYYRCSGKSRVVSEIRCTSSSISAKIIEPLIWNAVIEVLSDPKIIAKYALKKIQNKQASDSNIMKLIELEKQLINLNNQEEKLLSAFRAEAITIDQLKSENLKLIELKKSLVQQRAALRNIKIVNLTEHQIKEKVKIYVKRFKLTARKLDFQKKQLEIRRVISSILIDKGYVRIRFSIPVYAHMSNMRPQPPSQRTSGLRKNSPRKNTSIHTSKSDF